LRCLHAQQLALLPQKAPWANHHHEGTNHDCAYVVKQKKRNICLISKRGERRSPSQQIRVIALRHCFLPDAQD